MAKIDRSKFKISTKQATKFSKNSEKIARDYKPSYIDYSSLPYELPMYKEIVCKDADDFAENIITILPYVIESSNNTWVSSGVCPVGGIAYQNRVIRHNDIAPGKQGFLCKKRMYGRNCVFCDKAAALYNQHQNVQKYQIPDELNFLKTSVRDFMLVIPQVGEQAGQICLWEVSNYLFTINFENEKKDWLLSQERELRSIYEKQKEMAKKGEQIQGKMITEEDLNIPDFTDPDNGADVRFIIRGSKINKKYSSIKFFRRDEPLTDEILDKTFDISSYFIFETDEKISELLTEALDISVDKKNGMETATGEDMQDFKLPEKDNESEPPFDGGLPSDNIDKTPPASTTNTEHVDQPAASTTEDGKTPCPHNISVKNSAVECMQCPPETKNACERF